MDFDILQQLSYHTLQVTLLPLKKVEIHGWLGAVIRNNLLFAAEQIQLSERETLREWITHFHLPKHHPLFASFSGGFPKPYTIQVHGIQGRPSDTLVLDRGEEVCFSLTLLGFASRYHKEFIRAITIMCEKGFGHPPAPFHLKKVMEVDARGNTKIIHDEFYTCEPLGLPIRLSDFSQESEESEKPSYIRLHFQTPLLLVNPVVKKMPHISYQDKMNLFPSFYQFMRSAYYRVSQLAAIYSDVNLQDLRLPTEESIDIFLEDASIAMLKDASIHWIKLKGPDRKGDRLSMIFKGYVGDLVFIGHIKRYLPLLLFLQAIGNGNDTVYGMGQFSIEVK